MNFKKIITFFFLLMLVSTAGLGQVKFGAKLNLGTSWISSDNLQNNFEFQKNNDADIRQWEVDYVPGLMIGIGGVAEYELGGNLSLQGALSYNYQRSRIDILYIEDNRTVGGDGVVETVTSEAEISSSRLALPVTVNYLIENYGTVLLAGLEVNVITTPEIESAETENVTAYNNNTAVNQELDAEAIITELDEFGAARLNFLIGAGKTVDMGGNKLSLQLKYHLPVTSSTMYTYNSRISFDDNSMKNNEVFGYFGKIDAEQDAPQYPLNDFKMHFFDLSIIYLF
ncbi:MAG: outer membrane beta-barrel protein [Candidatus Cyclobacteriaceae bacterium M2_1C_046]